MRALSMLCLLPLAGMSQDRWVEFRSGPSEVWTNASAHAGREMLGRFAQFRHVLGQTVGDHDLNSEVPIRILIFRSSKDVPFGSVLHARDRLAIPITAGSVFPREVLRDCARLLLESSTERIPAGIERGLADLFSTFEVSGARVTLGRPLPDHERNRDWARLHLLATDPQYSGKLRVLIGNLRRGIEEGPAYRNAFGKSPAEIDQEAERHLTAVEFQSVLVSGRPLHADRDFPEKPLDADTVRLAIADLLLGEQSRAAYESMIRQKLNVAEAFEGLGLLAQRGGQPDAARKHFLAAIEAGSQSARPYLEYGRLEPDSTMASAALEKALALHPNIAEAHWLLAQRQTNARKRIEHLKQATSLNPRNVEYWEALAKTYLAEHEFPEAAKAWRGAQQAATEESQRDRIARAQMAIEQQRLDYEAAERKRIAEDKEREIRRLKQAAIAELRALEAAANRDSAPDEPGKTVIPWWDDPRPRAQLHGRLTQVDCLARRFRLVVTGDDKKIYKFLIPDLKRVVIRGGGEEILSCGAQKPRTVIVDYFSKSDAKTATTGEVAILEFQ